MKATTERTQVTVRIRRDVIDRVRDEAKKENRSLGNYIETVLLEYTSNIPNEETRKSIEEAERGEFAGKLDISNDEAFLSSIDKVI